MMNDKNKLLLLIRDKALSYFSRLVKLLTGEICSTFPAKCGHSFCYECICRCLDQSPRCPKCNFHLDGKNDVFPNFVLNELVAKHKNVEEQRRRHNNSVANLLSQPEASELKDILFDTAPKLGLSDIDYIMNLLSER